MGGLSEKTLNYQHLAMIYDAIMGDLEGVKRYAKMLQDVINGQKVLDLACGTGDLTVVLNDLGYQMTGLDISEQMLEVAMKKDTLGNIRFICGDMLNLHLNEVYDSIICANDSVNYCSSLDQLSQLLQGVNRHLITGGVFVFDYHQMSRLDEFKEPFDEEGMVGDIGYWWHIESDPPVLRHTITIYGNSYPITETHEQYIFELADLQKMLVDNGFRWEIIDSANHDDLYLNEKWMIQAIKERDI
jgi:ubiquinone/menaquinone biosynthesis C-methylase UbiE